MAERLEIVEREKFQAGVARILREHLSEQTLLWFVTVGVVSAWGYALYAPEPLRLVAAGAFTISGYLPLLYRKR